MLICNIPFNTITYAPEGHQSCCLHNMKVHKGLTDEEFWNCDEMRAMRKGFLDGKPVGQCGQCVKYHLALKGNEGLPPPGFYFGELDKLDTVRAKYENYMTTDRLNEVSKLEPVIAVLNVSNKCNLACRSCSPFLTNTQATFRRKAGFEV